jgi:vacuolar-type H+-ATPase subunit E/Vma4
MDDTIRRILKVEEEAKAIAAQGERDAEAVLDYVRREAKKIREDARARAQEEGTRITDSAVAAAREAARKYLENAAEAARKSAAVDEPRRAKAVQAVMDALLPEPASDAGRTGGSERR